MHLVSFVSPDKMVETYLQFFQLGEARIMVPEGNSDLNLQKYSDILVFPLLFYRSPW